jgi:hypothetical protein
VGPADQATGIAAISPAGSPARAASAVVGGAPRAWVRENPPGAARPPAL